VNEAREQISMAKSVLIVEDNELNMKLFHDLLEAQGYDIFQTRDGNRALDMARENMPDLILMDIQLPEVSGLDVIKWLKADDALKHIPVIAVTAFAMKGDEEKIREGGCEAYIAKPISVSHFLETVQKFSGFLHGCGSAPLFHFLFLEQHVFTRFGVVLLEFELIGRLTRIFLRHVVITGVGGAHEFDQNGIGFSHRLYSYDFRL
jgi:two-component system cell cycle response regulator DivK